MGLRSRLIGAASLCLMLSLATVAACTGPGPTTNTTTTTITTTSTTSGAAGETPGDITADEASPAQRVLDAVYTSVVNIAVRGTANGLTGQGIGSGIVYTSDGYIMTNDHVVTLGGAVTSGQLITVTLSSGEQLPATLVGRDAEKDLAAIKVERTGLTPVTFAAAGDLELAEWAIVIGSPLDFRNSVTLGIVSGLDRTLDPGGGQAPLAGLIQLDAAISPGNSGGGCFDAQGHFVGMPEVYLPPGSTGAENIGFAIPSGVVASVAKALTGQVNQSPD